MNSPKKQALMQEQFPEGRTFAPVNDHSKKIIKEQGKVEAPELLEVGDGYVTSCTSVATADVFIACANRNPVVEEQIRHTVKQQLDLLTNRAFLLVKGSDIRRKFGTKQQARVKAKEEAKPKKLSIKQGYTSILDRWTRYDAYRASQLVSEGWDEKKQYGWIHATRQEFTSSG